MFIYFIPKWVPTIGWTSSSKFFKKKAGYNGKIEKWSVIAL